MILRPEEEAEEKDTGIKAIWLFDFVIFLYPSKTLKINIYYRQHFHDSVS